MGVDSLVFRVHRLQTAIQELHPCVFQWRIAAKFLSARYVQDEKLNMGRFDFVKLRDPNEVRGMISSGYEYAERMDAAGALQPHFGTGP